MQDSLFCRVSPNTSYQHKMSGYFFSENDTKLSCYSIIPYKMSTTPNREGISIVKNYVAVDYLTVLFRIICVSMSH